MQRHHSSPPGAYRQNVVFRSFSARLLFPCGRTVEKIIRSDSLAHARLVAQDLAERDGADLVEVLPAEPPQPAPTLYLSPAELIERYSLTLEGPASRPFVSCPVPERLKADGQVEAVRRHAREIRDLLLSRPDSGR